MALILVSASLLYLGVLILWREASWRFRLLPGIRGDMPKRRQRVIAEGCFSAGLAFLGLAGALIVMSPRSPVYPLIAGNTGSQAFVYGLSASPLAYVLVCLLRLRRLDRQADAEKAALERLGSPNEPDPDR